MKSPWLWRAGALLILTSWFALTAPLSPLDTWGFDVFLRLKGPLVGPVSSRIALLDITEKQINHWATMRDEYDGLAHQIDLLRRQGAQVIALDIMLVRGKDEDLAQFWAQVVDQVDIVLGRTHDQVTRLPANQKQAEGLLNMSGDSDGKIRQYSFYSKDLQGQEQPSLALASFLNLRELTFDPKMVGPDKLYLSDIDATGQIVNKVLPRRVYLDERATLAQSTERNFLRVSPEQLDVWEKEGGNPHLAGRIVFISYTADGAGDLGRTPLSPRAPKVRVHALALNALMQDAWFMPTSLLVNCLLSLTLVLAAHRRPLVAVVGNLLWLSATAALPLMTHYFLPWVTLLLAWNGCCFGEHWLAARIRHQRLKEMQKLADGEDPLILTVVGAYQIVRKLGSGGFATVYQAVPTSTLDPARSVALKIVHPGAAESEDFRRRFLREIRISSQLRHPHIVEVHPASKNLTPLHLIMELLEGRPLRSYLVEGHPLSEAQVVSLLRPMLEALAYAHSKSVVHRDLKPENVMVRTRSLTPPWEFYDLKLVDFGLAFDSQASQLTRSGEIFGTLDYLAPERIQGQNDDVRSDLYAVGVMAYEMLAGQNPFKHSNPGEAILQRLTQDATHLSEFCPTVTPRLVHLITSMIARDPAQRPASAREILDKL